MEAVEPRLVFNATLASAIAPVEVAPGSAATTVDLSQHFSDPTVTGTSAVIIQTPQGSIPLELFGSQAPNTVQNFLNYVNSGAYNSTIVHRLASNFVIQGGGYTSSGAHISTSAPIALEYGIPNSTGTIAMARTSDPNSATSEWFINTVDNSKTLAPGGADNFGYAVFGKVVYNGMQTVNSIASLTVVNDSAQNGAWDTLPVMNYSGSSTPTSVPAANMVTTTAAVASILTYSVSSDNTALVTPSVSGSALSLAYGSGKGSANITVTATDLGGNVATSTFAVNVGAVSVSVGKGAAAKSVRFTDPDGTAAQVSVSGPGVATVSLQGSGLTQSTSKSGITTITGTPSSISISTTGTTAASTLRITGSGGNGLVNVTGITADADLGNITAPTTDVSGNVSSAGVLNNLSLAAADGGTLSATTFGKVQIKGASSDSLSTAGGLVSFKAGAITGGTFSASGAVGTVTASTISGLTTSFGTLKSLTASGTVDVSAIKVTGDIGSVAVGGLTGSSVFAGVGSSGLPAAAGDFNAASTLTSLRVGKGGYASSNVAAQTLGRLTLGAVSPANGGTAFGVAGHVIQNLSATIRRKISLKNVTTQAQVTTALQAVVPQDFVIRIV